MDNERKRRIAHEVMILLGVLALLTFITRLWPILMMVMLGILICALRLLFVKAKTAEAIAPASPPSEPPSPESELSIVQKAFGLLQRRITEQIGMQYPGARWVWGVTNAIEHFKNNAPLIILLNGAGGYNKAQVVVHNLMFRGLRFVSLETERIQPITPPAASPVPPPTELPAELQDDNGCDETENELPDEVPVNYERLAFEWVDANMESINARYNESLAEKQSEMLIPSEDLPHPDSWADVCKELKRNGFAVADLCEDGIKVNTMQ